jgi:hypothetical protein
LGDLTLDAAGEPDELWYARTQLDRLPVEPYVIPRNHDIGDNPSRHTAGSVTTERLAKWAEAMAPTGGRSSSAGGGWWASTRSCSALASPPRTISGHLIEPHGLAQLTIGVDFPDPYGATS